jgi:hypothetical protein
MDFMVSVETDFTHTHEQTVNMDRLIGVEGRQTLQHTLAGLEKRKALLPGETEGILNWKRVEDEALPGQRGAHYSLSIAPAALPKVNGLRKLTVHLRLHGAVTEIWHEAEFTRPGEGATNLSVDERRQVQCVVNRSFNQLLVYNLASRLSQRVNTSQRLKQRLNTSRLTMNVQIANQNNIQTFVRSH